MFLTSDSRGTATETITQAKAKVEIKQAILKSLEQGKNIQEILQDL